MESIFRCDEQEHDNWCWAAVSESVHRYLYPDTPLKQCQIATEVLGEPCCSDVLPNQLNAPAYLQESLGKIDVLRSPSNGPMEFEDLKNQLDASLPVCARIQWPEQDRGHFVTIIGYGLTKSGEEWIDVADPFFGYLNVPYEWFRHSYQEIGYWSDSFLINVPKMRSKIG